MIFKNISIYCLPLRSQAFLKFRDFLSGNVTKQVYFWIGEQRTKHKNALGLCSSKVVLNDNLKRESKEKTAAELLLAGMFFRFFHKVLMVHCQLGGLKNQSSLVCQVFCGVPLQILQSAPHSNSDVSGLCNLFSL